MLQARTLLLCFLISSVVSAAETIFLPAQGDYGNAPRLQRQGDRFSGESFLVLKTRSIRTGQVLGFGRVLCIGEITNDKPPDSILLSISFEHESWENLKLFSASDNKVHGLIDGRKSEFLMNFDSEVLEKGVREDHILHIPLKQFSEVANAKEFELQLGLFEIKFTDEAMSGLKKLSGYIPRGEFDEIVIADSKGSQGRASAHFGTPWQHRHVCARVNGLVYHALIG